MHSVVLKNDAVGDLLHSMGAINNITSSKENKKVTIFLSKLSQKYIFLVKNPKVEVKILNYNLNIFEKIKLFLFFARNKVDKVYILAPKNFYFFLPLLFRKIKFYAICINNLNNYKRPNLFFRKFLFKFEINDREKIFKRESTQLIQNRLTSNAQIRDYDYNFNIIVKKSNKLDNYLPEKYVFFHYKNERFVNLGWRFNELQLLFNELSKYFNNIVLTKDNVIDKNNLLFKENFKSYDFKLDKFLDKKTNVLFFDNIEGEDLFNTIKFSEKVIAFHGMMTSLGYLLRKPVLDFFCLNTNNRVDYIRTRNSFYEFKPKHKNYDFIIPNQNMNRTIRKIQFSLKKCLKS